MKILVVGRNDQFEECRSKLEGHDFVHITSHNEVANKISDAEVTFDFLTSEVPESFQIYSSTSATVFLNTWKVSLAKLVFNTGTPPRGTIFGFNGFPTMFNREFLELSALNAKDSSSLDDISLKLKSRYCLVDDRVGFVTPRVICMIINEAYYTVQEGTASREDIDLAMKLGTNYPYGPFEWCQRIGLRHVYELLEAVYHDTVDERYKISALMRKEYLATVRSSEG